MMKALFKKISSTVWTATIPIVFSLLAWMRYSSDGDRVNLAFAVALTVLTILAIYFDFFHKPKEAEEEATD